MPSVSGFQDQIEPGNEASNAFSTPPGTTRDGRIGMDLALQLWGGGFYLLNKILLALAEGKRAGVQRRLRILGWVVYLLGVPAWVIILMGKHNWIAASIEAGGVPAMLFGLVNVYQKKTAPDKTLDRLTSAITYVFIILGVCYSLYDYGGLVAVSQLLEICAMTGFLLGSYLLAKHNRIGWLLFMLMNGSMAALMFIQHKPILTVQQLVSLCFVAYGFRMAVKTAKA